MRTPITITTLACLTLTLFTLAARADEPPCPPPNRTLSLDATALVTGQSLEGKPDLFTDRHGFRYLFASSESKAAFDATPEKYELQLGGACARMGPLSGKGTTTLHAVHDGRIFVFASESCRERFLKEPALHDDRPDPKPTPSPASTEQGRVLLDRMIQGMGGPSAIDAVQSIRLESRWSQRQGDKDYPRRKAWLYRFPSDVRLDDDWGTEYPYALISTPTVAFSRTASTLEDLSTPDRWFLERQFHRSPLAIARARTRPDFIALADGNALVEDIQAQVLTVWFDGTRTTLLLEPTSGHVLATRFRARGKGGVLGNLELRYAPPQALDSLRLTTSARASFNNERWPAGDLDIKDITLNDATDADFTRPEAPVPSK